MAKIPKFSDLTSGMPGMLDKMKSFVDSLASSSKTAAVEEALEQETDPLKIKMLEVSMLINQFQDAINVQQQILASLKSRYADLHHELLEKLPPTHSDENQEQNQSSD